MYFLFICKKLNYISDVKVIVLHPFVIGTNLLLKFDVFMVSLYVVFASSTGAITCDSWNRMSGV